jgi:hypothetical protein
VRRKLEIIEGILKKETDELVCYVVGMGALDKSTYKLLSNEKGIEVIWYGSILPGILRIISPLVASYAGIVKVLDPEKISSVFFQLTERSMAGLYIFSSEYEATFVNNVILNPTPRKYDYGIKELSNYFIYIVDADNYESSTGIYEIVSYGKDERLFSEYF